jgi:outer membrane usher protein
VTFRTPSFASLGQTTPNNLTFLDTQFLYGQRLDRDLYASLGVGREFSRGSQADVTTADLNFSLPLGREVTAYLLLGTRRSSEGEIENRMFLSISWFPFGSGHRFGSSYDTSMQSRRLDWSYTSPTRVNAVDADLSVNRTADDDLLDGSVTYTGYRFTSRAAQTTTTGRQEGDGHSQRTALNFGTALAFAGGHVAVSRPIADSFVLFPQHPVLSSQDIEVNPVDDKPAARSDLLGMAVLPDMTSYYQHHVVLDAPDLPLGYELGRQIYDVQPTYRSGIVIPVGTGATVLGDGVLVDPGGRPLPLEPGQILSLDTPGQPAIDFFTSRSGRFRVEGLAPGRYRLTLLNTPERAIEFTIPPGSAGRFDLGRLTYDIEP